MGIGQGKISEYSKLLREIIIRSQGGLTAVGNALGEDRRAVYYWVNSGVPLIKCGEIAVFLFNDFSQRWIFNFEKVYEYEKWRGKNNDILQIWEKVISKAPIDAESKRMLMRIK